MEERSKKDQLAETRRLITEAKATAVETRRAAQAARKLIKEMHALLRPSSNDEK